MRRLTREGREREIPEAARELGRTKLWTPEEEAALIAAMKIHGQRYTLISERLGGTRTPAAIEQHVRKMLKDGKKVPETTARHKWQAQEEQQRQKKRRLAETRSDTSCTADDLDDSWASEVDMGCKVVPGETNNGKPWDSIEQANFLVALKLFGHNWRKVSEHVGTRTYQQTREYARRYIKELEESG